jgi:hypothetical protein
MEISAMVYFKDLAILKREFLFSVECKVLPVSRIDMFEINFYTSVPFF